MTMEISGLTSGSDADETIDERTRAAGMEFDQQQGIVAFEQSVFAVNAQNGGAL